MGSRATFEAPSARDEAWMAQAACAGQGPDAMFPVTMNAQEVAAGDHCATCPVRRPCLTYALEHGIDHGVWGGCSELQRRQLRSRLRRGVSLDDAVADVTAVAPPSKRPPPARPQYGAEVFEFVAQRSAGVRAKDVAAHLGVEPRAAMRQLQALHDAGHLARAARGLYVMKEPARG